MTYINECEKGRIKPHKFQVDSTLKGKNKQIQSFVKTLPVINICGVTGCNHCKSLYENYVKELVSLGALSVLLYRAQEPDVKLWVYKEK